MAGSYMPKKVGIAQKLNLGQASVYRILAKAKGDRK